MQAETGFARAAHHFLIFRTVDAAVEDVPLQHDARLHIVGLAVEAVDILTDAAPRIDADRGIKIAIGLFDHGVRRVDIGRCFLHLRVVLPRFGNGFAQSSA